MASILSGPQSVKYSQDTKQFRQNILDFQYQHKKNKMVLPSANILDAENGELHFLNNALDEYNVCRHW